ncbi:MAG: zinc ribbon domain-containing protein [Lachnospiraceae bacterium]|nr:zinc ribbon domain-containing protein [Lachnospiraceae bacterium]
MERKKRVSVGVVLMGFFLLVVMLAGVAGLIAHEVLLREATVGMGSDRETFSVIGALHILLEIGFKNGNTWVSILSASARDYIAIGLMTTGILLFIIAGFTKNHIMYLIAMLMTGASVFMKRLLTLITNPGFLFRQVGGGTLGLFGTVRLIMELMLVTAWILLLVVWLLSIIKAGKVKKGTGDPDKSLVIGFIPGLLMILAYLGFGTFETFAMIDGNPEMMVYVLNREFGSAWTGFPEVEVFGTLAIGVRYLFLSFQFALLILFAGLWLNRPHKRLSPEEKALALKQKREAEAEKAQAASYGAPYGAQYGAQMNTQYGQQYGPQYGAQMNLQYGQQYGPQYGQQYGPQYGAQMNSQYGQQYGPQYGAQMNPQYAPKAEPAPAPQPAPAPVPVFVKAPETNADEPEEVIVPVAEEVREETAEAVEEVKEEAAETVEELKEAVPEAVEEVKEETVETVEELKEAVPETIEEVKEEVREAAPQFKFCPNCGFPLPGAGRFCPKCGYKLHD